LPRRKTFSGGRSARSFVQNVERLVVVVVDGRDERLRVDLELRGQELPAPADRFLLPVIADREVPEHLEEGVVIGVGPHHVQVRGAEALLDRDEALCRRLLLPEEVRDDRLHPGAGEQDARIVLQDEGRAGQAVMALLFEELDEPARGSSGCLLAVSLHVTKNAGHGRWTGSRVPRRKG